MHVDVNKPELMPMPIWRCKNPACQTWMREEFTVEASPECPLCKGAMLKGIKHLPKLVTRYKKKRMPFVQ